MSMSGSVYVARSRRLPGDVDVGSVHDGHSSRSKLMSIHVSSSACSSRVLGDVDVGSVYVARSNRFPVDVNVHGQFLRLQQLGPG